MTKYDPRYLPEPSSNSSHWGLEHFVHSTSLWAPPSFHSTNAPLGFQNILFWDFVTGAAVENDERRGSPKVCKGQEIRRISSQYLLQSLPTGKKFKKTGRMGDS